MGLVLKVLGRSRGVKGLESFRQVLMVLGVESLAQPQIGPSPTCLSRIGLLTAVPSLGQFLFCFFFEEGGDGIADFHSPNRVRPTPPTV